MNHKIRTWLRKRRETMKFGNKTVFCILLGLSLVGCSQRRAVREQNQRTVVSDKQQQAKVKMSKPRDARPRTVAVGRTVTTDLHKWQLKSIELRNNRTIAHWSVTSLRPNTGIWIDNKISITDRATGRIFKINGFSNIGGSKAKPRLLPYAKQTVTFELYFPSLPAGVSSIDYCMGERTISNIKLE